MGTNESYLNTMEGMIAMSLYHTIVAKQKASREAIFTFVFASNIPGIAGETEIVTMEVSTAIMVE